jgi:hypothetical protein
MRAMKEIRLLKDLLNFNTKEMIKTFIGELLELEEKIWLSHVYVKF